jgi:hypothetical protein
MEKRIWMYWPGEKAYQFKENVEKGFMACGLNEDENKRQREVGDLDEIMDAEEGLENALKEAYGPGRRIADGWKLLTEFANLMQVGDFILARNDYDTIVGVGIVASDYYYDSNRPRFRHCRKVKWIDTTVRPFPDELKRGVKWNRVTLMENFYRKIGEEIISVVCGNEDIGIADAEGNPPAETKIKDSGEVMTRRAHHDHASFMSEARQYQESIVRQWAKEFGDVCIWDERPHHGVWLKDEYALKGLVFYEGFRREILEMYRDDRTKIGLNLLNNALRSEHIPYNLFFPMMKEQNKDATCDFFNDLLGTDGIAEVLQVRIEFAPQPKSDYLNDGTAFDAFVLYRHKDGSKGAVGIEVKYTEREYKIGETEYKNTHDEQGNVRLSPHYAQATNKSGYYIPNCEAELVSDNLRQIWRNHILGASMVLHGDICHFVSMTVFPNANPHFHSVAAEYREVLTEKGKNTFFIFTYEKLFEILSHHFTSEEHQKWIQYLYKRYLFCQ